MEVLERMKETLIKSSILKLISKFTKDASIYLYWKGKWGKLDSKQGITEINGDLKLTVTPDVIIKVVLRETIEKEKRKNDLKNNGSKKI